MAIDKAMVLLSDDEQTGDRAILILSDGEDHGDGGVAAAQRAADAGVFLYAIGIGTPSGAPIPVGGGGFKKDRAGQVVISRLQEDRLQEIAAIGRGAYVRSVAGAGDMQTIYQEQIRGQLTAAEQGVRREKIWTERYMLFLALGLALIVASYLLRPGALRLGPAAASILLLTVGTARADTLDALLQQQAAAPDDMALAEEVGEALFEAGRFDEAAGVLEQVAQRGGSQQQDRARYNAGLARYYAGQLTAALEDWQRILSEDPDHTAAQQNATAVEAEIQARLQQQQEQEQEQQDSDEECDNPQEGEDGEPQDSDSDSDSEEQDSDSDSEPQDSDSEPEESESHDGTMEPPPEEPLAEQSLDTEEEQSAPSPSAEPSSEESAQAAQASELSEEELAEAAARRLLDSVEEGEPRVTVGEQSRGGNDW
jgi:Ca-activated chloride channel family protein